MWNTALGVSSLIWIALSVYVIYAFGDMLLHGQWKQFLISLLLWAIATGTEVLLATLSE